jgi:hypothetical protein
MTTAFRPAVASLVSAAALSMALGGCKIDNRPLLARGDTPATPIEVGLPAPGPLDPGYAVAAPAEPLAQAYAYPARAYALNRTVDQAPPNYAFGYGDTQPWVWDTPDEGMMFAEPIDDGWRSYYYEPGTAYPYFVQEPDYGYAYGDGGVLLAVFDAAGVLIGADRYGPYEHRARDYWRRGYDFDRAFQRAPRHRVDEADWRTRGPRLQASQDRWFQAAAAQPAWRRTETGQGFAAHHDDGRRLGWDKERGRQVVAASPPPDWAGRGRTAVAGAPPHREDRAPARAATPRVWREARQDWSPQHDHEPQPSTQGAPEPARVASPQHEFQAGGEARGGQPRVWREARQEGPPQYGRGPEPQAPATPEAQPFRHGGGRVFAQGDERHGGPPAAPPAAAQPRHQGGPPPGQGGGHGGQGGGGKSGQGVHGRGRGD